MRVSLTKQLLLLLQHTESDSADSGCRRIYVHVQQQIAARLVERDVEGRRSAIQSHLSGSSARVCRIRSKSRRYGNAGVQAGFK